MGAIVKLSRQNALDCGQLFGFFCKHYGFVRVGILRMPTGHLWWLVHSARLGCTRCMRALNGVAPCCVAGPPMARRSGCGRGKLDSYSRTWPRRAKGTTGIREQLRIVVRQWRLEYLIVMSSCINKLLCLRAIPVQAQKKEAARRLPPGGRRRQECHRRSAVFSAFPCGPCAWDAA